MKVLYFITCYGNNYGIGGHYYSLKTSIEALSKKIKPIVLTIGLEKSPVLSSVKFNNYFIYFNGINFLNTFLILTDIYKKERPNVFHSFDIESYFFARVMSHLTEKPVIHTLCGGPNPIKYYSIVDNFILYSIENKKYFENNKRFKLKNVYLIPNRVLNIKDDNYRIEQLRNYIDKNKKIILRITRFSKNYESTIKQSINLTNNLNKDGIRCQLLLIGVIAEKEVYERIKALENKNIKIVTDEYFTINANELVNIADIVIGTGRGLMEAASKSKILLSPINNSKYPVIITESNFLDLFATNFSPRNNLINYDEDDNYKKIVKTLINENELLKLREFYYLTFQKYFNIENKINEYFHIYSNLKYSKKVYMIDLLEHLFYTTIKSFQHKFK